VCVFVKLQFNALLMNSLTALCALFEEKQEKKDAIELKKVDKQLVKFDETRPKW